MKVFLLIATLLFFGQVTPGQEKAKSKLIRIPKANRLISVTSQPDCPLKIVETEAFTNYEGKYPILRFKVRNDANRPIRYFSVAFLKRFNVRSWGPFGLGDEFGVGDEKGNGRNILLRGEVYSNWRDNEFEVVPINKQVSSLFGSAENIRMLKIVWIGLVTKVVFEDGSVFDSKNAYDDLQGFWPEPE